MPLQPMERGDIYLTDFPEIKKTGMNFKNN
jgi:hypothetical protein